MYFVYILFSHSTGRYYTGSTADMVSRLIHHNSGANRSTRMGAPWILEKVFEVANRTEALKLEAKIKKRGAGRFLDDLNIER